MMLADKEKLLCGLQGHEKKTQETDRVTGIFTEVAPALDRGSQAAPRLEILPQPESLRSLEAEELADAEEIHGRMTSSSRAKKAECAFSGAAAPPVENSAHGGGCGDSEPHRARADAGEKSGHEDGVREDGTQVDGAPAYQVALGISADKQNGAVCSHSATNTTEEKLLESRARSPSLLCSDFVTSTTAEKLPESKGPSFSFLCSHSATNTTGEKLPASPPSQSQLCGRQNPPQSTAMDADQYRLYAACYQWYYQVMCSAKRKAARASASAQEQISAEAALPDSKKAVVSRWLKRPARQQVDEQELRRYSHTEGGTEYNIWYGKYLTDRYANKSYRDRETAPYKCVPERDAGYTLADTETPSSDNYFCIYFARGACALGKNCRYRHSIPTLDDEAYLEWSHDIFGRERFKCHRDDMDGVGSFNSDCKTLFVCGFRLEPAEPDALRRAEEFLRKEFEVWGDIEDVRVIPKKQIAFISYCYRVQAEFAKAAMADQNLGPQAPLLVVKWAIHNPHASHKRPRGLEEERQQALVRQETSADAEAGANEPPASSQGNNITDVTAQSFERLLKCRRTGSNDETVDALRELLQQQCESWRQHCENWQQQLKTYQMLKEQKTGCSAAAATSLCAAGGWTAAPGRLEGSSGDDCGVTAPSLGDGAASSVFPLSSSCSGETSSLPPAGTSVPEMCHETSLEEMYEAQASAAAACNRIEGILKTVENLEPSAFEVQI